MHTKIEQLLEGQQRMEIVLTRHQEHMANRDEMVDSLFDVVVGNGHPGLKGHVASLLEARRNLRWMFGLIWSAIAGVAGWLAGR